jgi:hypothetical protein
MKNALRFVAGGVVLLLLGVVLTFCERDSQTDPKDSVNLSTPVNTIGTPNQVIKGEVPKATVKLLDPATYRMKDGPVPSELLPAEVSRTLMDGEYFMEEKLAKMTSAPPKGDVVFMFDLTGSMYDAIENAKANSINTMTAIRSVMADTDFGVISHMDYPASYDYCEYATTYGDASYGDYPYRMDQAITADLTAVNGAVGALELGYGYDGPEDYARALYETTADPAIGWRGGAKKVVVAWLDNVPHDCNLAHPDYPGGTGVDPGRDGVAGTGDDLDIEAVVSEMAAQNILLIVLYSGYSELDLAYWSSMATQTGGNAFQVNYDGTIPDGTHVAEFIAQKIEEGVALVNNVHLEVCTPGFEGWLTNVDPMVYENVTLPTDLEFNLTFTVPEGTLGGLYEFDVCLIGDGVVFAKQHVKITVVWKVPLDIHPMSCPNPLNRGGGGLLPVAILGTADLDVTMIDPESLTIGGVNPVKWDFEDVGTPDEPFWDKELDKMSCNILGPDGYMDLTLKLDNRLFGANFPGAAKGDILLIWVKGMMLDGTPLYGQDIMVVVK